MSSDDEFSLEDSENDASDFESETENLETEDQDEEVVRVLTYSDIREIMKSKIEEVREILEVTSGVCRVLLQKYKWDKTTLLEKFYEDPNFIVNSKISLTMRTDSSDSSSDGECDICCDTAPLLGLSCDHTACIECWRAYLTEKINEKKCEIQCMSSDCKLIIDDDKIHEYLSSETTVISAFQQLTVDEYVETNHFLTQCSCGMVLESSRSDAHLVVCSCGTRFCFSCGNDSHEPVNCRLLKLWEKKCVGVKDKAGADGYSSDKETFNWILSNTKDCPKCVTSIEKNGGCNRITCRSKTCRFEFCWLCMREWSVHGYSSCNTFNEKDEKNRVDSRAELHRFLFFYNRFKSHEQSFKLEKKLVKTVNVKMDEMQKKGMGWADVLFLRKSVDILSECRRTLMFTYIFAFYLERNNQAIMFDGNQKDLEMAVEQLSGLLEQEMETNDLRVLIQKTQDKSRYVEYRRKVLLDHCTEGMEQDAWVYNA